MEGAATCTPAQARQVRPKRSLGRDLAPLVLLVLLAAGSRLWLLCNTAVAARDSIGFIRYAWQLERRPWREVLRENPQHPGYPVLLLAVSHPVRQLCGGLNPYTMQLSAQLASALAGVLLVFPMYYLGREIFDRRVGFWGAALFQCLPVSGQILADGLSEATFLLFTASALLAAARGLRRRSVGDFGWCGLFVGLSYLTRPEGSLLLPATLTVLGAWQVLRYGWQDGGRTLAGAGALTAVCCLVGLPYVATIGRLTNKPTPLQVLSVSEPHAFEVGPFQTRGSGASEATAGIGVTAQPLTAIVLADYLTEKGSLYQGLWILSRMAAKGYFYIGWVFGLLGLWWFRRRLSHVPGAWLLLALCLLHSLILWRLAVVVGYVSERHVLILVLCGVYWVAADLLAIGQLSRSLWAGKAMPNLHQQTRNCALGLMLLLILAGPALAGTLQPLHPSRTGHRAAGEWLARHAQPGDVIYDPASWAHYYAGWLFREGEQPTVGTPYTRYVVYEPNQSHERLPLYKPIPELIQGGQVVYHWPEQVEAAAARVHVVAVPVR